MKNSMQSDKKKLKIWKEKERESGSEEKLNPTVYCAPSSLFRE